LHGAIYAPGGGNGWINGSSVVLVASSHEIPTGDITATRTDAAVPAESGSIPTVSKQSVQLRSQINTQCGKYVDVKRRVRHKQHIWTLVGLFASEIRHWMDKHIIIGWTDVA
jgi:hypothetical protein